MKHTLGKDASPRELVTGAATPNTLFTGRNKTGKALVTNNKGVSQ